MALEGDGAACWLEEGLIEGVAALSSAIEAFRVAAPLAVVSYFAPEEHHNYVHFRWQTNLNNETDAFGGDDFVEVGDDGRFRRVVSFKRSAGEGGEQE